MAEKPDSFFADDLAALKLSDRQLDHAVRLWLSKTLQCDILLVVANESELVQAMTSAARDYQKHNPDLFDDRRLRRLRGL